MENTTFGKSQSWFEVEPSGQSSFQKLKFWSYLTVFSLNAGKYGPEKTPYLDTFHAVNSVIFTVTLTFTPKAGILLKVITVVRIENLALFTGTSIYSIRKSTKNRNRKIKLINKEV